MASAPAHPETTRLENFTFGNGTVGFELDGRPVRLGKETAGPAVDSFQTFYTSALADYRQRAPEQSKPGWFARLRSWLGRLIGGHPQEASEPHPARQTEVIPMRPSPRSRAQPDPAEPGPERRPLAQPAPERGAEAAASPPCLPGKAAPDPVLRAVFADRGGIHLLWRAPDPSGKSVSMERLHPLDSELARRLADCYGQLDALGYRVVGLDLLPTASPGRTPAPDPLPNSPVPTPAPREPPTASPGADSAKAPAKKDATSVMRLHPEVLEQPTRALVSPVDNAENAQVLVAPEKVLRALRAAADPARPEAQRLTYLRCAQAKSGLKVVDVGLGEGKDHGPASWEEFAKWLPRQQAEAEEQVRRPRPDAAAAAPLRPGSEPEFSF